MTLPDDIGAIDAIVGFHIRLAHGAVYRHFSEHFAALSLTQKEVSVLWLAHDHPGIAQTDLARRLRMDRATTMGIVHKLEARDLIAREASTVDRRRIALRLTDAGGALFVEAVAAIRTHERWLAAKLAPGEAGELVRLLRKIHD